MSNAIYPIGVALVSLSLAGCDPRVRDDVPTGDSAARHASPVRIELFSQGSLPAAFDVVGLTAEQLAAIDRLDAPAREALLRAYVDNRRADSPPILGVVSIEREVLRFTPRFPLEPGVRYRAVFDPRNIPVLGGRELSATFETPRRAAGKPAFVTQIYPSTNRLPENQLKFYLHFSVPMSRGQAYQHIHLLDESGQPMEGTFLELDQELWNDDQTRFTLLCDPGRVKRGLKPREELGPVLEQGKHYTLVVDRGWCDANGAPLEAEFRKEFDVLEPDIEPIDVAAWTIETPRAETNDPLTVRFPESLDHSLLDRVLSIVDAKGKNLGGSIEIADQETAWSFRPDRPWNEGEYQLVAATTLEDLAGNSIGRAFEVDTSKANPQPVQPPSVAIPFVVAGAAEQ